MRKTASILIAATMAATLAGCSSEGMDSQNVQGESATQEQKADAPLIDTNVTKDVSLAGVSMKVSPNWKSSAEGSEVGCTFRPSSSSVFSLNVYNDDRCNDAEEYATQQTILGSDYQIEKTWTDGGTTYTVMTAKIDDGGSHALLTGYNEQGYSIALFVNYGSKETADAECVKVRDKVIDSVSFDPNDVGDAFVGKLEKTLNSMGSFDTVTVDGSGDDVVDIPCAGSPCIMSVSSSGGGHFAVKTMDSSGNQTDLLVNEIAPYSGIVTDYLDYKDSTMLQISADGSWSITFSPMSEITLAESGDSFVGDNVVGIDASELSKIGFTHDGESNFTVKAIGMNKSNLLVNEIGSYDGTVIWNEPQSFFIVSADGTWTITY